MPMVPRHHRVPQHANMYALRMHGQARSIFGLFKRKPKAEAPVAPPPVLGPDNLFHKLSESPIPSMRARGERIRSLAPCPVSMSKYGVRRLVNFECPVRGEVSGAMA